MSGQPKNRPGATPGGFLRVLPAWTGPEAALLIGRDEERSAAPHSSQTNFSDRPQASHRNVMKSGVVTRASCAATITTAPQVRHAGFSPVSKGTAGIPRHWLWRCS
jgi:hypothetical protein